MKRIRLALLAAVFGLSASAAGAQEDGGAASVFQGLLSGLGIVEQSRPPIDYRQRAPLVLPRSNDLPAPQQSAAARSPNWPNDPDAARARAAGLAASGPSTRGDVEDARTLTNAEMRARGASWFGGGRVDTTRQRSEQAIAGPASADEMGVSPIWRQVGSIFSSGQSEAAVPFPGEPQRRRLVEPPPGYRTASPDAPYGPVGRRPYDPQGAYNRDRQSGQDPARGTN